MIGRDSRTRPSSATIFSACLAAPVLMISASACGRAEDASVARVDTTYFAGVAVRVETVHVADTAVAFGAYGGDEDEASPPTGDASASDLAYLRSRRLMVPVRGISPGELIDSFNDKRGRRRHAAIDILAPRGTPVLSADAGRVVKLHTSAGGGISVYAEDPTGRFIYYYAHLDRYHPGLSEGMPLAKGDVIGYVGTTGNAPPTVPHLHFAVGRMDAERRWWKTTPINPRPLLVDQAEAR